MTDSASALFTGSPLRMADALALMDEYKQATAYWEDRARKAEELLAHVVLSVGRVEVSHFELQDIDKIELMTWRNDANGSVVLEARRCQVAAPLHST